MKNSSAGNQKKDTRKHPSTCEIIHDFDNTNKIQLFSQNVK